MSPPSDVPSWVQALVAVLLVASGLLALSGAVGIFRLKEFFQRMHPPALASTLGTWCTCAASIIWFSALGSRPLVHTWVIPILLCISVPITTLFLARAALFRMREAGAAVPATLSGSGRIPPPDERGSRGGGRPGRQDRRPEPGDDIPGRGGGAGPVG